MFTKTIIKKRLAVFISAALLAVMAAGCAGTSAAATGKARGVRATSGGAASESEQAQGGAASESEQAQGGAAAGYTGFTFSTHDIDGNLVNESVFNHDGITMLNFWASWCGPCMSELEALQRLNEEGVVKVIGVIVNDTEKNFRAAIANKGVTYPSVYMDDKLQGLLGNAIPFSIFYDSRGRMLGSYTGAKSYAQWVAFIDGLQ